jgi:quercetin dioxygenase-like cupin family protein
MKHYVTILTGALALFSATSNAQSTSTPTLHRTDLQQHDLSMQGYQAIQVRVDFDPKAAAPKHRHSGEEIIYVLEGELEYTVEGRQPVTLKAGDVLFVPAETYHTATNVGPGTARELATYVVRKGKPLVELAQ